MKKKTTKNLLERFSCFLIGSGKKTSGHKILMESLFSLREKINLNQFSRDKYEKDKNFGSLNITEPKEQFQYEKKAIQQFLCLPCVSILIDNKTEEKKTLPFFQHTQQFKKTQQKEIIENEVEKNEENQKVHEVDPRMIDCKITPRRTEGWVYFSFVEQTKKNSRENSSELVSKKNQLNKNLCFDCVDNVKPVLETRKIRKGRVTYKVPKVTSFVRQEGKAISLLIESANFRKKNEDKRSTSFIGDINTISQNSTNVKNLLSKANYENAESFSENINILSRSQKKLVSLPVLFSSRTVIAQSLTKTSLNSAFDSFFFILPSNDQNFDRKNNNVIKEKKQNFLQSEFLKNEKVDKNSFFVNPEKKYFVTNLQNIKYCLSEEFFDSVNAKGNSIEKRKQLHNTALQNRAYQHFRWW